jgi:hypothetical protein
MKSVLLLLLAILIVITPVQGQADGVYVTVQDNAALRAGPGTRWDQLAVLPYGTTYPATGRTVDGDWIQVAYAGPLAPAARTEFTRDGVTYGWIASWLLVWTGNILELPIDGVVTVPIARAAGPVIVIGPHSFVYEGIIDPSTRVPSPVASPVRVEVTGRLGSAENGHFWLQFKLHGKFYWTGSWAAGIPSGYSQLPDAAYLYPYSRLSRLLDQNIRRANTILNDIGGRWLALSQGRPATCNAIPDNFVRIGFSTSDLGIVPTFAPTEVGLTEAETSINAALSLFRQVCQEPDRQVRPELIQVALAHIQSAERTLNVLENLRRPLQQRDPILAN